MKTVRHSGFNLRLISSLAFTVMAGTQPCTATSGAPHPVSKAIRQQDAAAVPVDIAKDDSDVSQGDTVAYLQKKLGTALTGAMNQSNSRFGYDYPFNGEIARQNSFEPYPEAVPFEGFGYKDLVVSKSNLRIGLRRPFECTVRGVFDPNLPHIPDQKFTGNVDLTVDVPLRKVRVISCTPGDVVITTLDDEFRAKVKDWMYASRVITDSVAFYSGKPDVVTTESVYNLKIGGVPVTTTNSTYHLLLGNMNYEDTQRIAKALRHLVRLVRALPDDPKPSELF